MRCPFCGHNDTQVKDSRPTEDNSAIRRRRHCPDCGARFTTFARVQLRDLTVLKKAGQKHAFSTKAEPPMTNGTSDKRKRSPADEEAPTSPRKVTALPASPDATKPDLLASASQARPSDDEKSWNGIED